MPAASIDEDAIVIADAAERSDATAGRQGAVGSWRNSFINAPYERNATIGFGIVAETLETSITWERWPAMDEMVRSALQDALQRDVRRRAAFPAVSPTSILMALLPTTPLKGLGQGRRRAGSPRGDQAGRLRRGHGRRRHHHPPPRRRSAPTVPGTTASAPTPSPKPSAPVKKTLDPNGILNPGVLIDP